MIPQNCNELRTLFLDSLHDEQRIDPQWVDAIDTLVSKLAHAYPLAPNLNPIEILFGKVLMRIAEDARADWAKMGMAEPGSYNNLWTTTQPPSSTN